jgi:hypothetical protein
MSMSFKLHETDFSDKYLLKVRFYKIFREVVKSPMVLGRK